MLSPSAALAKALVSVTTSQPVGAFELSRPLNFRVFGGFAMAPRRTLRHAGVDTHTGADPRAQDEIHVHDTGQPKVETDPNKFDSQLRLLEACRCASEHAIRCELHGGADPNKCLRIGTASTSPLPLQLVAGSPGDARAAVCCSVLLQFGAKVIPAALKAADRAGNVAARRCLDRERDPTETLSTPPPQPTSSTEKAQKNTCRPKVGWVALGRTLGRTLFRALKGEDLTQADMALRQIEDRSLHEVARMAAVSWYDGCRYTPLHAAAVVGAVDAVQRLLALGACPSWETAHGADVLSVACSAQQVQIVALLKELAAKASPVFSTTMQTSREPKVDSCQQYDHACACRPVDTQQFVVSAETSETEAPGLPEMDCSTSEKMLTPHVSPTQIQLPPPLLESCSSVTKEHSPGTIEHLVREMSEGLPTFESAASEQNDLSPNGREICTTERYSDEPPPTIQSIASAPNQESPLPTFESFASAPNQESPLATFESFASVPNQESPLVTFEGLASVPSQESPLPIFENPTSVPNHESSLPTFKSLAGLSNEHCLPINEDNLRVTSSQALSPHDSDIDSPSTSERITRLAQSSEGIAAVSGVFESPSTSSKRATGSNRRLLQACANSSLHTRKSSSSRSVKSKVQNTRRPRSSPSSNKWNGKRTCATHASVQASAKECKLTASSINGHLLRACGQRNLKLINSLLARGASAICKRTSDGFSPLHIILAPRPVSHRQLPSKSDCRGENDEKLKLQCAKAILDADSAAATTLDVHGYPALFLAVKSGSFSLTELVLEAKPVIATHAATTTRTTAMHLAAATGFTKLIAPLARAGARLDAPMVNGRTPLAAASRLGHIKFVQALLASGVSVQQECGAESALKLALEKRHSHVAAVLLEAGAPVTHRIIELAKLSGSATVKAKLHSRIQCERENRLQQAETLRVEAAKEIRAASLALTSAH